MVDKLLSNPAIINDFFTNLGFSQDETSVFLSLHEGGSATVLELSKQVGIPRSSLYRLLEMMKQKGLVNELVEEYRAVYSAADFSQLELLIKKEEEKVSSLKNLFPQVSGVLKEKQMLSQPATKVYFYKGVDGISQMLWNVLAAKNEFVGYTYRLLDEFIGNKFMQSWREEFQARKLTGRDIYSDAFVQSKKSNLLKNTKYNTLDHCWKSKYIKKGILDIDHQTDIYNDIVGIYNWYEGEVFGIEIHNKKVANFQRQIFEIVWAQALPERN